MHTCNETSLIFCFFKKISSYSKGSGNNGKCLRNVGAYDLLKAPTKLSVSGGDQTIWRNENDPSSSKIDKTKKCIHQLRLKNGA